MTLDEVKKKMNVDGLVTGSVIVPMQCYNWLIGQAEKLGEARWVHKNWFKWNVNKWHNRISFILSEKPECTCREEYGNKPDPCCPKCGYHYDDENYRVPNKQQADEPDWDYFQEVADECPDGDAWLAKAILWLKDRITDET